ncbi:hypothetical protein DESC_120197 [Desulfosarcina cetonica]|nr:hypothetical protein DESC_120197 [Desulfosarcina cetonica]
MALMQIFSHKTQLILNIIQTCRVIKITIEFLTISGPLRSFLI